jgi:hypothetical protein
MDCGSGVECDVDDRNSPPPNVKREPLFHQRIGNIAERMIEKMREDVGEHHQPAGEPDLPNADAAQPIGNAGRDADPKVFTPAIAGASTDVRRPYSDVNGASLINFDWHRRQHGRQHVHLPQSTTVQGTGTRRKPL